MYICTLVEFISSRCSHIAVHLENKILNGIYTGLYRSGMLNSNTVNSKFHLI